MSNSTRAQRQAKSHQRTADVDDLVTALLTASRVLVAVSARSLTQVEETLTLAQFRTLVVLDSRGELNLNGLAGLLDVNASTAMRMIDRLLAAELVTRRDNPANRRQVILGLTPEGKRIVRQATARRRRDITRIVTAMPADRRTALIDALRAFTQAADEPDPGAAATALGW